MTSRTSTRSRQHACYRSGMIVGDFVRARETRSGLGTPDHHNRVWWGRRCDYAARGVAWWRWRGVGGARWRWRGGSRSRGMGASGRADGRRATGEPSRAEPSREADARASRAERGPSGACPRSDAVDDPTASDRRASQGGTPEPVALACAPERSGRIFTRVQDSSGVYRAARVSIDRAVTVLSRRRRCPRGGASPGRRQKESQDSPLT